MRLLKPHPDTVPGDFPFGDRPMGLRTADASRPIFLGPRRIDTHGPPAAYQSCRLKFPLSETYCRLHLHHTYSVRHHRSHEPSALSGASHTESLDHTHMLTAPHHTRLYSQCSPTPSTSSISPLHLRCRPCIAPRMRSLLRQRPPVQAVSCDPCASPMQYRHTPLHSRRYDQTFADALGYF